MEGWTGDIIGAVGSSAMVRRAKLYDWMQDDRNLLTCSIGDVVRLLRRACLVTNGCEALRTMYSLR